MQLIDETGEVQAAVSDIFSALTRLTVAALRNTDVDTGPLKTKNGER